MNPELIARSFTLVVKAIRIPMTRQHPSGVYTLGNRNTGVEQVYVRTLPLPTPANRGDWVMYHRDMPIGVLTNKQMNEEDKNGQQ